MGWQASKSSFDESRKSAKRKQVLLRKFLSGSSIDPSCYAGLLDCTIKQCGRDRCSPGCVFGDRRWKREHLPKVHDLFLRQSSPVYEVRLARANWNRPLGKLGTASVAPAKQLNRRALDKLYYPDLIAVGTLKTPVHLFGEETRWVPEIHELISGVDQQADLERVFGGSWQLREYPSVLEIRPVADLLDAVKRVFACGLEAWAHRIGGVPDEALVPKRRHRAEFYASLFAQNPGDRAIRYGCDRHFNKLRKKPRLVRAKERKPRPYPHWLKHYMFGGELWSGHDPHSMNFRPKKRSIRRADAPPPANYFALESSPPATTEVPLVVSPPLRDSTSKRRRR